jgi:hypothetical protein
MTAQQGLDTLPFDVFYQIATSLDDRDFVNLSRTNRALYSLSQSEQIARKTVEVDQVSPLARSTILIPVYRMFYFIVKKVRLPWRPSLGFVKLSGIGLLFTRLSPRQIHIQWSA